MLTDEIKEQIRDHYTQLSERMPNFRKRRGQMRMVAEVSKILANPRTKGAETESTGNNIIVAQAPTGTGKTLSYLLPGIIIAKALGKKLIVSTATAALQEQLVERDLPALMDAAGLEGNYEIVKGRNRYVCSERLQRFSGNAAQDTMFGDAVWDHPPKADEVMALGTLLTQYEQGTWNGERDSLPEPMADTVWQSLTNDSHGCANRRCDHFKSCAFFKARRRIKDADIIVANHALVLAAVSRPESKILPDPEDALFIFDEAHHLPDCAVSAFSATHGIEGTIKWLERAKATAKPIAVLVKDPSLANVIVDSADQVALTLGELGAALARDDSLAANAIRRYPNGQIDDNLAQMGAMILTAAEALQEGIARMMEAIEAAHKDCEAVTAMRLNKAQSDLGFFANRTDNLIQVWDLMLAAPSTTHSPVAKWIERLPSGKGRAQHQVGAATTAAGPLLQRFLWNRCAAAVLTSATLTTVNGFHYYRTNAGLADYPTVIELDVPSPFDLARQGIVHVFPMRNSPKMADKHTIEIIELMPSLIEREGGTLVLFASRKQMQEVAAAMPTKLKECILIQGDKPRHALLEDHARRISAGGYSVIFGLASFAEGLDLPGALCAHVIISKMPFAPPTGVVEQTVAEWITSRSGDPFNELSVPAVSLKLIQWCGRLIRTETDFGRVTILDNRLASTGYGRRLLKALPPFTILTGQSMPKAA